MRLIVDENSITPVLDRLEKAIRVNGPLGESIGNIAVDEVIENFETQGSNIGQKWDPLKKRQGAPLRDTGLLMGSIHSEIHGGNIEVIASRTTDSKNGQVDIAWVHNYGSRDGRIPQREFMGISDGGKQDIEDLVDDIVREVRK